MTLVGYLWVDAIEHNADYQRELLRRRGVDVVYEDLSAKVADAIRPQLTAALEVVGPGDTLVVWRLDRLASTMTGVLSLLELLGRRGVGVAAISEELDTSAGHGGEDLLKIISAFTELDRCLTRQRTLRGVYAARARGRVGGRPRALSATNVDRVLMMRDAGSTVREIAQEMGTSRATVYRVLEQAAADRDTEPTTRPGLTVRFHSPGSAAEAAD